MKAKSQFDGVDLDGQPMKIEVHQGAAPGELTLSSGIRRAPLALNNAADDVQTPAMQVDNHAQGAKYSRACGQHLRPFTLRGMYHERGHDERIVRAGSA